MENSKLNNEEKCEQIRNDIKHLDEEMAKREKETQDKIYLIEGESEQNMKVVK